MPKGHSLHIALNHIDPVFYDNWDGRLTCCENDAQATMEMCKRHGFSNSTFLINEKATIGAVTESIKKLKTDSKPGDLVVISYSGHGGSVPDKNYDEKHDFADETWLLFDDQLIDDELFDCLSEFEEGVRLLVISDSCHSGTIVRNASTHLDSVRQLEAAMEEMNYRPKCPSKSKARSIYKSRKKHYNRKQNVRNASPENVKATLVLLAACQDNQKAWEGFGPCSLFTESLQEVWDNGKFGGDYTLLHKSIKSGMPPAQTPNLFWAGKNTAAFLKQSIFSI